MPLISVTIFSVLGSSGNQTLDGGSGCTLMYCTDTEVPHSFLCMHGG